MNEKWDDMNLLLPEIDKILESMHKGLDGLKVFALPETIEATELDLMNTIIEVEDLRAKFDASVFRCNALRVHFAKLRKAQLEAALAPPQPTTETGEVSGQGPVPTPPDAETAPENIGDSDEGKEK